MDSQTETTFAQQEVQISALNTRVANLEKTLTELKGFIEGLKAAEHRRD